MKYFMIIWGIFMISIGLFMTTTITPYDVPIFCIFGGYFIGFGMCMSANNNTEEDD